MVFFSICMVYFSVRGRFAHHFEGAINWLSLLLLYRDVSMQILKGVVVNDRFLRIFFPGAFNAYHYHEIRDQR